jgi:sugar phosphate isomerase/epimerase
MGPSFSVERLARLRAEVGSRRLKVLIDPVNLVTQDTYYDTAPLLHRLFDALGDHVISAHAKDTCMSGGQRNERGRLAVCHLDEEIPGQGTLDYPTFLRRLDALGHEVVSYVEHLASQDDIVVALRHIRHVAGQQGIALG